MATIKDVAKLAQVSATTVSLILNGKSEERRISPATREKVLAAMNELGYQPNLSARRLRANDAKKPTIAFYWPIDYRTNILASFLNSFQNRVKELDFECELVIQTYENDHLEANAEPIIRNSYNAVIIGATTEKDMEFLNTLDPQMPVVLINRMADKFSSVCINTEETGMLAARLFRQKGYTEAAILASARPYMATGLRTQAFIKACSQLGIRVDQDWILLDQGTISGGVQAAKNYCRLYNPPKAIFCDSDAIAIGAVYTFNQHNIRMPEDVELLSIGMLDPESTEYTVPSISIIIMPNNKVMASAVDIVKEAIQTSNLAPVHIDISPEVIMRESFTEK